MRKILLVGAGKSSTVLIDYLLEQSVENNWKVRIGEISVELAQQKLKNHPNGEAVFLDVNNEELRKQLVEQADIVISLLPPTMHFILARDCVSLKTPLITASYVSDEIRKLSVDAAASGVLLLNEMGVDPGIDHMSAMEVINRIKSEGGEFTGFETFTGGLLAPDSEKNNPWRYKFTWNPRNVVLSGQGMVKFVQEGLFKYIPYHRLFRRTEIITFPEYGEFEGYANRDSLRYRTDYGLQEIKTIYRGTLRRPGFCRTWDAFVQLGATDDTFSMENSEKLSNREFINSFLYYNPIDRVELKLAHYLGWDVDSYEMHMLRWLGIFDDSQRPGLKNATPAQMLQHILEQKWSLEPNDRDMIAMYHQFDFKLDGRDKRIKAYMIAEGDDQQRTAMAKTVGLPLGIAAKNVLNGVIKETGVIIPTEKGIYEPVLAELKEFGINFIEKEEEL